MRKLATVFVILSGCLWGTMGLFVHALNAVGISAMQMVEIRAVATTVLLFLLLGIVRPALLKINLRHLWCFAGSGIVSVVFFNFCYFTTIENSSMSVAAVLLYTSPVFVMLLSRFLFKEALNAKKWIALALAVGGCVLVSGLLSGDAPLSLVGFLTGIGAGLGYALYSIFSRYAIQYGYSGWTITAYTFLFAAIGGALFTDFGGIIQPLCETPLATTGFFILFAAVTTLLPYLFYTTGLAHIENSKAAVIVSIEPVVASLLGLTRGEYPSPITIVGIVCILGAVLLLSYEKPKNKA